MTTMTIQVENASILSSLKKILGAIDGVTIVKQHRQAKKKEHDITKTAGYMEAMEDKAAGRIAGPFNSADELFNHLGI